MSSQGRFDHENLASLLAIAASRSDCFRVKKRRNFTLAGAELADIRGPPQQRHCEDLSRPVQLGFIGRLQIEQKRIDRIPPFCSELSKFGVPFNLRVLGAGQERELLESNCGSHPITLTGALQGDAYWHEIRAMDFLVFFSDYEGTPIAMLEAMSQGVIPIYPSIGTGGDAYVARISPDLLYPPGDVAAAAAIVKRLSETESGYIHKLRGRARETVRHHSPKNYLKGVFDFAKTTNDGSRISSKRVFDSEST